MSDDDGGLGCSDDDNKFNFERKSGLAQTIGELSEEFPLCKGGSTNLLVQ